MKIELVPYQAKWAVLFEEYQANIFDALVTLNAEVRHIGSTSVPGLSAKPIIDIMVGLPNEKALDSCIAPMIAADFIYYRAYTEMIPERRFFLKLSGKSAPQIIDDAAWEYRKHGFVGQANIHIVVKGKAWWNRHIAFRDHLREHEQDRLAYENLKQSLAKEAWENTNQYAQAKTKFIRAIESKLNL